MKTRKEFNENLIMLFDKYGSNSISIDSEIDWCYGKVQIKCLHRSYPINIIQMKMKSTETPQMFSWRFRDKLELYTKWFYSLKELY